ncbi:MAG: hypothetical protein ACTHU0_27110 [Kofleriaceae bacterium]
MIDVFAIDTPDTVIVDVSPEPSFAWSSDEPARHYGEQETIRLMWTDESGVQLIATVIATNVFHDVEVDADPDVPNEAIDLLRYDLGRRNSGRPCLWRRWSLDAERRANALEMSRERDRVARATLRAHIATLDMEIKTRVDATAGKDGAR